MNIENKKFDQGLNLENFKTPLKILDLNFKAVEALEKIPNQIESKQNKKIAKQLTEYLIKGEVIKIVFFPRGVGFEAPPLWSGNLGEDLKFFLGAIFPHKNQKEVTKAIRERREIDFKLSEKLEIPVNSVSQFASVKIKSIYNGFNENKNPSIRDFADELSQSLRSGGKTEIPRGSLGAERDLRRLLGITFEEVENGKIRCRQIFNLLRKGKEIVLEIKKI